MKTFLKNFLKRSWAFILPIALQAQAPITPFIVIDQFGYLPESKKTAVIRNPMSGFDAGQNLPTPGATYQVVNARTNQPVFTGSPVQFSNGATDPQSGDRVWWFDFSAVTDSGRYYILDVENNIKSYPFPINETVYNHVLKHAVRMLFYQRAGCEKLAKYAGEGWADKASHMALARQRNTAISDFNNDPGIAGTERDLHGGWYDAGDQHRYTPHIVGYIETLLQIYLERPEAWADDYNIPESGNGIPDLLDEIKWGLDYLLRLQEPDGSVISHVEVAHTKPPSLATKASLYQLPSTHCTLGAVLPYALGSYVFGQFPEFEEYAETLKEAALKAWDWAHVPANQNVKPVTNPDWYDNWSSKGMVQRRMKAAIYLYQLTGETKYSDIFVQGYRNGNNRFDLFSNNGNNGSMSQYNMGQQFFLFYVLQMDGISETVKNNIRAAFKYSFDRNNGEYAYRIGRDAYRSWIKDYNWGSNQYKSTYGSTFYLYGEHSITPANDKINKDAAEDFLHYIHGVNPFGWVYLSNMDNYGTTRSLNEIFHSWFMEDSQNRWNNAKTSKYGPAPGFLAGGPNQFNNAAPECCLTKCSSFPERCKPVQYLRDFTNPPAKCYADTNIGWPMETWVISEPSCGYQIEYIRLLSKFVNLDKKQEPDAVLSALTVTPGTLVPTFDPAVTSYTVSVASDVTEIQIQATANDAQASVTGTGTKTLVYGSNIFNIKVTAEDGTTEKTYNVTVTRATDLLSHGISALRIYPNPAKDYIKVSGLQTGETLRIFDLSGRVLLVKEVTKETENIAIDNLSAGMYLLKTGNAVAKVIKN